MLAEHLKTDRELLTEHFELINVGHKLLAELVDDLRDLEEVKNGSAILTCPDDRYDIAEICLGLLNSPTLADLSRLSIMLVAKTELVAELGCMLDDIEADFQLAKNKIPGFLQDVHRLTACQSSSQVEALVETAGRNLEKITEILARLAKSYKEIISSTQHMDMDPPDEESLSNFPQEIDRPDLDEGSASNLAPEPNIGSPQPTTEIVPFRETLGPHISSPFEESGGPELLELSSDILQTLGGGFL